MSRCAKRTDKNMKTDKAALVAALKKKRETEGLSIRALAERIGVSFSSLARIERGEGEPDNNSSIRIMEWLGDDARASLIAVASATYLGVTLLTLWQALRNESIATPGAMTFGGFAVVLSLTAIATAAIITRARAEDRRSPVSRL